MEKIRLWWKFEGRYYISNFKRGLKNLWYWLPIIWKDRDYDHFYIYTILAEKLKKQAKYIGDRDFHTRAKRDSEIMLTCVNLIEKIKDDFYDSEHIDYYESTHEFIPAKNDDGSLMEGYSEMKVTEISENFDEYFKKYPLIYNRVRSGDFIYSGSDKRTIAMNIACINQDRAEKLLWSIIRNNINRWWD